MGQAARARAGLLERGWGQRAPARPTPSAPLASERDSGGSRIVPPRASEHHTNSPVLKTQLEPD